MHRPTLPRLRGFRFPRATDKWRLGEVVVTINGVNHRLWRAIDADGDALDFLVQPRRDAKAARRFLNRMPRSGVVQSCEGRVVGVGVRSRA